MAERGQPGTSRRRNTAATSTSSAVQSQSGVTEAEPALQEPPRLYTREDLLAVLRESLSLELRTSSNYTGDMDGSGNLYANSHSIRLMLDGEVISEIDL